MPLHIPASHHRIATTSTHPVVIKIKSSRIYRNEFIKGIRYFQKLSGSSQPGILIYDGELEIEKEEAVVKNFRNVWP